MAIPRCLACHARRATNRGNCRRCYERLRVQVAAGHATWPELEAAGRALPAQSSRQLMARLHPETTFSSQNCL